MLNMETPPGTSPVKSNDNVPVAVVLTERQKRRKEALDRFERIKPAAPKTPTFGSRVLDARMQKGLSQEQVANHTGLGRTAVTQWELNRSVPDIRTIQLVAQLLDEEPSWLAYGVRQAAPIVDPDPKRLGYALIPEVQFNDSPTSITELNKNGISTSRLREMGVKDPSKVILFRVQSGFEDFQAGDYVIVDRNMTRPSPAGIFLHWDGFGPSLGEITIIPTKVGDKLLARVNPGHGTYQVDADALAIIGRVIGVQKRV